MNKNRLAIILEAIDRWSKPSKAFLGTVAKVNKATKKSQRAMGQLERGNASGRGYGRLAKTIGRVNRALKDQAYNSRIVYRLNKKMEAIDQRRSKLQSKFMGTAAMAVSAGAPILTAAGVEQAEIRLKTVLNSPNGKKALETSRSVGRMLARAGLTGFTEAYDIQYALNSAGLSSEAASAGAPIVAKVAKITAGLPERVGEVIAGTYNNLGDSLEGSTSEKLNRIGELLTKTQFKFAIRDFGQLGDSLAEAGAGMAAAKLPLAQGITLLGHLNTAEMKGGRAGTALSAVLRQMGKASEDFGFQIERNADDQLDMIATLENLESALSVYDDIDERNMALQEAFGDEGKKGLVPLLEKLDQLRSAQADVEEGSKGIVEENWKLFSQSTKGQWNKLIGSVTVLADAFGRVLLPGVNAVLAPLAGILNFIADLAIRFPTVTATIGGVVTALIALRVALFAGKLAALVFKGTMIGSQIGLLRFMSAIPKVITGIRVMSIAMMTTPIGLIVGGIALAAGLVIANWEKVKSVFMTIWEPIKPYWEAFAGWVGKIWDVISAPFTALGKLMGSGSLPKVVEKAQRIVEPARAAQAAVVSTALAVSPVVGANTAQPVTQNNTFQITIQAQPGQDAREIADQVAKVIEERQRGALHD